MGGQCAVRDPSMVQSNFDRYRMLPPPMRSAIFNGIAVLHTLEFVEFANSIPMIETLTSALTEIEDALIPIARAMTSDEIDEIAKCGDPKDQPQHKQALITLLETPRINYSETDRHWFPAEAIEIVSHVPNSQGYVPATAIVLLDAIRHGDDREHVSFRFASQWKEYEVLPKNVRATFHAAIRYLYETDRNWAPSFDTYNQSGGDRDVAIDWSPSPLQ